MFFFFFTDVRDICLCWREHCAVHCIKIFTTGMANRSIKWYGQHSYKIFYSFPILCYDIPTRVTLDFVILN